MRYFLCPPIPPYSSYSDGDESDTEYNIESAFDAVLSLGGSQKITTLKNSYLISVQEATEHQCLNPQNPSQDVKNLYSFRIRSADGGNVGDLESGEEVTEVVSQNSNDELLFWVRRKRRIDE